MDRENPPGAVVLVPVVPSPRLPEIALAPGDTATVGRGTRADVVIDDAGISRVHARLTLTPDGAVRVEDLGSTNGIAVNGTRQQTAALRPNDVVAFGFIQYRMVQGAPRSKTSTTAPSHTITSIPISPTAMTGVDRGLLEGLLATSRELMAFGDLPGLLERVLDRVQTILQSDRAAILLVDASDALTPRAVRPRGAWGSVSEFASSTVIRQALSTREAIIIGNPALDPALQGAHSLVEARVHSAICVPLMGRTGPIGALYIDRVGAAPAFTAEFAQYAASFASFAGAALETAKLYDDRERHFRATLEAFAKAIDARDPYTAGHSDRVTAYAQALAAGAGLPEVERETMRLGSKLHDIGKVGIADAVLRKEGPFTPEERLAIEAHPIIGCRMLESLPFLSEALPCVRSHHERWDGDGYPDRLAGTDIHPHARLLAVADTYDAMTSARPYRGPLPREEAARRIRAERGRQFEPSAVDLFEEIEPEFHELRQRAGARGD